MIPRLGYRAEREDIARARQTLLQAKQAMAKTNTSLALMKSASRSDALPCGSDDEPQTELVLGVGQ